MKKQGLFVGLITGDMLYLANHVPQSNEKVVALDYCFTAGGPVTNAAITFSHCGSQAKLMGALGHKALGSFLREKIADHGVEVIDIQIEGDLDPPISSIIVSESTGDRSVISLNTKVFFPSQISNSIRSLHGIDVILIDGHQMQLGAAIAEQAKSVGIPVVVDGGSWKDNFETVLRWADVVICSANFFPPKCNDIAAVVGYLQDVGVGAIAITQGGKPILWWQGDRQGEIAIPKTKVVDTLGAGDMLHGAFCHYILKQDFETALGSAAAVASYSCQFFGTRVWLNGDRFGSE